MNLWLRWLRETAGLLGPASSFSISPFSASCLTHRPSLSEMTGKKLWKNLFNYSGNGMKTSALYVHWNVQELDYLWWVPARRNVFGPCKGYQRSQFILDAAEKASFWKSGDWDNSLALPWAAPKEARLTLPFSTVLYIRRRGKLHVLPVSSHPLEDQVI